MSDLVQIRENGHIIEITRDEYLKRFNEYCDKIASSKELAQEIMIEAGIHTPDGKLAPPYNL